MLLREVCNSTMLVINNIKRLTLLKQIKSGLRLLSVISRLLKKNRRLLYVWALFMCTFFSMNGHAQEPRITVAVASNFRFPLEQVIKNSDTWSQQNIRLVTGSSGVLYAQILKGAPFDVFLSADKQRPEALVLNGLAASSTPYALGKLALWPVPKKILLNRMATQAKIKRLLDTHSGKFAIAHPDLAPFGKVALGYLEKHTKNSQLLNNLVLGNNITQAFQFVDSGNATIGLIAESLLIQAGMQFKQAKYKNYILLNEGSYPTIVQHMVVLNRTFKGRFQQSPEQKAQQIAQHKQAIAFTEFLISPQVQSQLTTMGYRPAAEACHE